jgi:hypothetical protein
MTSGHLFVTPILVGALSAGLQAQTPSVNTILDRAAAYVRDFQRQLSGIVAEETYTQQEIPGSRREMHSDLLLVRPAGLDRWLPFRDVFEVDGQAVRDREERLSRLFLQPAETALGQARRIVAESSRYNLGELIRTINVPLLPLIVLESENRARFRFTRREKDEQGGTAAGLPDSPYFRVATEVTVLRFDERRSPTIIRDPALNRDVFSYGRFWIEESTGRVLMSEMVSEGQTVRAEIAVSYRSEPVLGLLLPVEMHETYTNKISRSVPGRRWARIEATAIYGRFRQFQVHVDETIEPLR